jgi:hypothetical protein
MKGPSPILQFFKFVFNQIHPSIQNFRLRIKLRFLGFTYIRFYQSMKSGIGSQKEVLMLKVSILFWLLRMEDTLLHRMCLENE